LHEINFLVDIEALELISNNNSSMNQYSVFILILADLGLWVYVKQKVSRFELKYYEMCKFSL